MQEISPELELIADYACETGENPLWHPSQKRLYWTDIPTGRLFRFDPAAHRHRQIYQGRPVGGFTFQADGGLLLFRDRGNIALWRDDQITELIAEIPEVLDTRFNDVVADPAGRVFCGTISGPQSKGRLFRLDLDGTLTTILHSIGCSNGMGFSPDLRTFYCTDSFAGEIYTFDYDIETGDLTHQQVFARVPASIGLPDGLAVDRQGRVWSALWDGSAFIRFDHPANIEPRFPLPPRKVPSPAFGGEDLCDTYITTAGGHTKQEDGPTAGALFRMKTETHGRPEFFSRITIPQPR